ncbi:hypothetical protein A5787_14275 [Mycobacterium sp. 852002-50816_SCH5313054-b]|uniref:hypothetical protein n=1 Tax=Mycobacterium sp. 852002-50816_SCH5313054-b TaxID=1834092 RepID=UPI0007FD2E89|nr:hypothetical protein [Mycobacterium sp. 852002-50816_SCH5313054-b]OBF43916.1 hypothetical protein A5787_14275 [Mycobacterium sp. 852002-50816_SCH5313054-b]
MSAPSLLGDEDWRDALKELSERISNNEADSIEARWEFGRVLLKQRGRNKQLPDGVLKEVVKTHGISRREVQYRMKFADKFTTEDEVRNALHTYGGSWRRICSKALPAEPKKPKSKFAEKFSRRLARMVNDAGVVENLLRDAEFPRYVDELREEWRDDERNEHCHARPGIRFAQHVITSAINRAHDELTADQGRLFEGETP